MLHMAIAIYTELQFYIQFYFESVMVCNIYHMTMAQKVIVYTVVE